MKHLGKIAAITGILFALQSTSVTAKDYNVTAVAGHPPVFRWVRMFPDSFEPAVNAALKGSGDTFSINGQYGGAIAGVGEELETVGAGLAEIGTCQALFDPAKLAVQNVTYYTPFVSDDFKLVAKVINQMHRTDPRMTAAYTDNDVVYLGAPIAIDDYLLMTNFPVNSLADLKGHKIAAPGAALNWLSGTGAVGVSGNLTTYYNQLKTGVYDGVIVFASAALPGKLYEVAPHITRVGLGAQFAGAICANKDWYDGLPAEVQNALTSAADTTLDWYNSDLGAAVDNAFAKMQAAGATVTVASDEMRQEWAAGMDNAAKSWAEGLDAKGQPATAILDEYMDAMRAAGAKPVRDWNKE
ncbi:C4-dicarboxylate TRAP transporter substrate-binding protein [Aquicoccus sp. G2-2]|uniref:C4-dicarboxylate TRAP transporter substrate-binding protein n=1 Tax=Aquicoccus sp. G2-2 TaxID=3092120 RepID=UPI002ADF2273|nr:C4-dicarboxylate TRAP transporter substrate-binding protein [Aquicoccus sp. G2-2]MEA1112287.1 C4-dicarboxylate TRAP transporter substrate-binding protein [Aquicoccus sp. G2-2]